MARGKTTYELDTKVLDRLIDHLDGNVEDAVNSAAFMVEGRAKVNVRQMDAIDTGALLNSIAVSMNNGGDMQKAMNEARARRPEANITPLPVPNNKFTAYVGPTVEYGQEVHDGNTHMGGRPYLRLALRQTEKDLRDALSKAIRDK